METFLTATALVAVAEIGDKTQLLSFMLAARLKHRSAIIWGILIATVLNHALAAAAGAWLAQWLPEGWLKWALVISFVAFGLWALLPDTLDDTTTPPAHTAWRVFMIALVAFFVAEIGDKTQFATVALGARFDGLTWVVLGTTLGMMIANIPAVLVGERLAQRLPGHIMRRVAAAGFMLTALITALN
ncbi:TMEM165/GDT1 family protein [Denitromonas ohlonensis]|uniref:GDT1 family protein n=2 Tax=Denitromonas TaxID=139331 RepID=A0A557SIZ0_9RHOO|nr:TMEM165/GDT1 family protein [Denitromonas ohlonensis]TVT50291.1 MAG: TMEM165/GDT1 family protein [Denitromonas halophila]TVO69210.1 TMEM165/GDT1 family protein [Denitromonas ohlonensis]TVO77310.1 TMEM165/GDT1 family protein [Denitromonas ohlonensis]TVT74962.1 MAG: TMEM165/GDT1 family protein [Denitromonas halophila]TVT78067.1 MAG: TMEM165/GDT1 family protein [Denitromonas halophila]